MINELDELIKSSIIITEKEKDKNNISDVDKSYFAGLLDGEGCIHIHKTNKPINYSLKVSFNISYKPILLKMKYFFGGSLSETNIEKRKKYKSTKKLVESSPGINPDKWKQIYQLSFSGKDALNFLKIIDPYCNEKKNQVSLAILYEEGKTSNIKRTKEEIERCEFYYIELQRLKQKV